MSWQVVPAAQFDAPRWQALHTASHASPLLHGDFVTALLAAFAPPDCVFASCDDAMALLVPHGCGSWSTFQPAQAPLGLWLQRPGTDSTALLAGLLRVLPGAPLLLGLTQCDPWLMARPADGAALHSLDYIDTAYIEIGRCFDEYWQGRGKNLRANLKKQRARLDKDGIRPTLRVSGEAADVAEAVAAYGRLERAGWKAGSGTAVSADNAQGVFYRQMLEAFCRRGAGRIYSYWFGQQLVAMDLCIEGDGHLIVLKTAYDESLPPNLSPALLMREEACRALFDCGRFSRIEFYGKAMEWHLRWTDRVRTLYHVNYYRWPLLRRVHLALTAARQARAPASSTITELACTSTKSEPS